MELVEHVAEERGKLVLRLAKFVERKLSRLDSQGILQIDRHGYSPIRKGFGGRPKRVKKRRARERKSPRAE